MGGATAPQPSKKRKRQTEGPQDGIGRISKKGKSKLRESGGKVPDSPLSRNREVNSSKRHTTARTPNVSDSEFASDCDPPLGIIRAPRSKKTGNKSIRPRVRNNVNKSPVIHLGAIELTDDDNIQKTPVKPRQKIKHPIISSSQNSEVIDLCSSDSKECPVEVHSVNEGDEPAAFLTPVSSPVQSVHKVQTHSKSKQHTTVNPPMDHAGPLSSPSKTILVVNKNDYILDKGTKSATTRVVFENRSFKSRKSICPYVPIFGSSKPKANRRHIQDMNGFLPTGLLTPLFFSRAISDATSKFIVALKRAKKMRQARSLAVETVEPFHKDITSLPSASISMNNDARKLKKEITNSRLLMDFLLTKKRPSSSVNCEALQLPQDTSSGSSTVHASCAPSASTFIGSIATKELIMPLSLEISQDDGSSDDSISLSDLELSYPPEADGVY